jgi:phosphoglucosamine mutase
MGFAFDGDADRMLAVDGQGRIVDGDHVLFLWGSVLQQQQQLPDQRLVATVMSNLGFERAWQQRGGLLDRTPVGDQHVHAAMVASGAALGGEQSGHILAASHGLCGDGVLTALQLATLCHAQGISLNDWLDRSFQAFPQKLVNVCVPDRSRRKGWASCLPLSDALRSAEEAMGDEGRVLVRASGTEPVLRVMVEAADQRMVDSWTAQLAAVADRHLNAA